MVHTHQSRDLRLELESRCVTDCMTNEVLSIETRNPHQEPSKSYEYRSFAEALKIPLFRSSYIAARKLYGWLRCKSCFCYCFLWYWKTVVVTFARLADSIFWVRLFLILVDSTVFRLITCLRQRYPVLDTTVNEITLAVKSTVDNYRKDVVTNSILVLSKLMVTGRFNVIIFMGVASLCDRLTTFLNKVENLVDWYFPFETAYGSTGNSSRSSGSNSVGYYVQQQENPADYGLNDVD